MYNYLIINSICRNLDVTTNLILSGYFHYYFLLYIFALPEVLPLGIWFVVAPCLRHFLFSTYKSNDK